LEAAGGRAPPGALARYHFTASRWQARPDGQPVDDDRPWRSGARAAHACAESPSGVVLGGAPISVDRVVAAMEGVTALPRKNGELVFDEPWQGRGVGGGGGLPQDGGYAGGGVPPAPVAPVRAAGARGGGVGYRPSCVS